MLPSLVIYNKCITSVSVSRDSFICIAASPCNSAGSRCGKTPSSDVTQRDTVAPIILWHNTCWKNTKQVIFSEIHTQNVCQYINTGSKKCIYPKTSRIIDQQSTLGLLLANFTWSIYLHSADDMFISLWIGGANFIFLSSHADIIFVTMQVFESGQ